MKTGFDKTELQEYLQAKGVEYTDKMERYRNEIESYQQRLVQCLGDDLWDVLDRFIASYPRIDAPDRLHTEHPKTEGAFLTKLGTAIYQKNLEMAFDVLAQYDVLADYQIDLHSSREELYEDKLAKLQKKLENCFKSKEEKTEARYEAFARCLEIGKIISREDPTPLKKVELRMERNELRKKMFGLRKEIREINTDIEETMRSQAGYRMAYAMEARRLIKKGIVDIAATASAFDKISNKDIKEFIIDADKSIFPFGKIRECVKDILADKLHLDFLKKKSLTSGEEKDLLEWKTALEAYGNGLKSIDDSVYAYFGALDLKDEALDSITTAHDKTFTLTKSGDVAAREAM